MNRLKHLESGKPDRAAFERGTGKGYSFLLEQKMGDVRVKFLEDALASAH